MLPVVPVFVTPTSMLRADHCSPLYEPDADLLSKIETASAVEIVPPARITAVAKYAFTFFQECRMSLE